MSPISCALADIRAFKQISDRIATSGQPAAAQFADIAAAGYETVINLVPPEQRLLPDEADIVRGLGMEYVNVPVVWTAPTREDLGRFFAEMDARAERLVFVHCAANMRVSAFVYLYRVLRRGEDPDDAEQDLLDIWNPQDTWRAFIDGALQSVPASQECRS